MDLLTTRKRLAFLVDKAAHHRYAGGSGRSRDPVVQAAIDASSKVEEAERHLKETVAAGRDPGAARVQAAVAHRDAAEAHQRASEGDKTSTGATREHYARTSAKHRAAGEEHAREAAKSPVGRHLLAGKTPGNSSPEIRARIAAGEPGPVGEGHPDVERWVTIDGHAVPITSAS